MKFPDPRPGNAQKLFKEPLHLPVAEIFQHGEAHVAAFFLVELACDQVVLADEPLECLGAIGRFGKSVFRGHYRMVRVHVVKVAAAADSLHNRVFACEIHLVPPHVRDLQTGLVLESHRLAGNKTERLHASVLLALFENNLAADADAENRVARLHHRLDGIADARAGKRLHRGRRGTHARENQAGRLRDFIRIATGLRIHADMRERIHHGCQVTCIVVNDDYGHGAFLMVKTRQK